jgi:hypothetical protein
VSDCYDLNPLRRKLIPQVRCLIYAVFQLPTIIITLYSAYSTRVPTSAAPAGEPPLINLLPLILATSTLPMYLLSFPATSTAGSGDALFPLLPLTLMMGLRGEEESWDVGVLISNVVMFRSVLGCMIQRGMS